MRLEFGTEARNNFGLGEIVTLPVLQQLVVLLRFSS